MATLLIAETSAERERAIRQAADVLAAGGLVALPTETVYGVAANAADAAAVERLLHAKGRPEDKPLTLATPSSGAARDWAPHVPPTGQRLARRCWPGPVTLVFNVDPIHGLVGRLPPSVVRVVSPQGSLGLRVPAHDLMRGVLEALPAPLVLTSANRSGEPDALDARQVEAALGDRVDLIVADGQAPLGCPSTVVRVNGGGCEVLREGAVSREEIERLASTIVLFVCTGNTCRSPLAEALCKKLLAEALGCQPGELERRGWLVLSAGISAGRGGAATPEAIRTAEGRGVDVSSHVSQPLTPTLLDWADHVFTMTQGHLRVVQRHAPRAAVTVETLSPTGEDLPDPIGGAQEEYDACAERIEAWLNERLPKLLG